MVKKSLISRRILMVACLLMFIFSTVCVYGQENATALIVAIRYERGVRLYKQGEYEKAIQEFQRILELNPKHKQAEKYVAVLKKEKTEKTIHRLYSQAEAYSRQGEYQQAIDTYQKVLEIMQDDGYSLYNIEILKARIEKTERQKRERRTQILNRLDRDLAKKKALENKRLAEERALQEQQQRIAEIKEHVDETVPEQYQKQEKSKIIAMALRDAEDAIAQKDKRFTELIAAIPQETMEDGFSLLQGLSGQEREKQIKLAYGAAKNYYKQKDYLRAIEAFQQVIVLEEGAARKRYTIHAKRYIKRANDQLDAIIEKELSEMEVKRP